MLATEEDILAQAESWKKSGKGVAIATVVETWGSAPRPVGSHLVIDEEGLFLGSVSGGCVEGDVVTEAQDVIADGKPRIGGDAGAGREEGRSEKDSGASVEAGEIGFGPAAEEPRRRPDPDQRIVLPVLMGIDRVVADGPGDAAERKQNRREAELAEDHRPAHQRPPRKGDAEPELRPVGHPLQEGIDRDRHERREADQDREPIELEQHDEADQGLGCEEHRGLPRADLAARAVDQVRTGVATPAPIV